MPRFSKKRTSINRRTRRRGKTRRTGRSRRGGEGERDAITDYDSARNDADWALTKSRKPENVPSSVWNKYPENPFNSDNQYIMAEYKHLGPVKGGKTKRKMRKHRK